MKALTWLSVIWGILTIWTFFTSFLEEDMEGKLYYLLFLPLPLAVLVFLRARVRHKIQTKERWHRAKAVAEKALSETQTGNVDKGLWARAFSESDGNQEKTSAIYIRLRQQEELGEESKIVVKDGFSTSQQSSSTHSRTVAIKKRTGLAMASLICGLCGLAYPVSILFFSSIAGIICGHMAMNRIRINPSEYDGLKLARAGLIISYVALGLGLVLGFTMGFLKTQIRSTVQGL